MTFKRPPFRNGPWTVESVRVAFDNPWLSLIDHRVIHPDGSPGEYGVVHFKNRAIGILAIDDEGRVPLVGQHRFPADAYSWELPEGGGPLNEDPLAAAKRELKEETGCEAAEWVELARFDVSNSVTDEAAVCYLASGLKSGTPEPDPTEVLNHKLVRFSALHDLVLDGEIRDSLTIVMVTLAHAKALRGAFSKAICERILGR